MCLSQTKRKNHKDLLYCGFGNSYSKSSNFDGYQMTLFTFLDETIGGIQQCWSKISPKNRISLKPEGKTIDTIYSNKQCLSKSNPKKASVSQNKGKNHEDWFYDGFWNSYSKSCNFFDGYQMTLITFLDDTIDGI